MGRKRRVPIVDPSETSLDWAKNKLTTPIYEWKIIKKIYMPGLIDLDDRVPLLTAEADARKQCRRPLAAHIEQFLLVLCVRLLLMKSVSHTTHLYDSMLCLKI